MKFRYKKYGPNILRPVIPVEIINKTNGKSVKYEVLVDSGADSCIFDAEISDILGFESNKCRMGKVSGITGVAETIFSCPIILKVGGAVAYETTANFLVGIAKNGYGVVGQQGFFDKFVVKFDLQSEDIEIKEKNKK